MWYSLSFLKVRFVTEEVLQMPAKDSHLLLFVSECFPLATKILPDLSDTPGRVLCLHSSPLLVAEPDVRSAGAFGSVGAATEWHREFSDMLDKFKNDSATVICLA